MVDMANDSRFRPMSRHYNQSLDSDLDGPDGAITSCTNEGNVLFRLLV